MRASWLADSDPRHAWEHQAWADFAAFAREDRCVFLPCAALGTDGPAAALDAHERRLSPLLRAVLDILGPALPHLVLPPLRQLPVFTPENLFAPDFATGHALFMALARGVQETGLRRLVLVHASPACVPLLATYAIDARAEFGLDTYVLDLGHPDFQDAAQGRPKPVAIASALLELRQHRRSTLPAGALPSLPPEASVSTAACLPQASEPLDALMGRYLPACTPAALRSLVADGNAELVLPTASIEQHGHHLPVGVDSILGQAYVEGLCEALPAGLPLLVAPPVIFGKSNEHKGFPGTLSVPAPVLYSFLERQFQQLLKFGFRKLHLLNTHGGNTALLRSLIQALECQPSTRGRVALLQSAFRPQLPAQEAAWGMHADDWETSLMMACAPHLVCWDKAVCEYPARLDEATRLKPEKSGLTFAWLSSDVSKSGVMGNALAASAEKGQAWLRAESEALAAKLAEGFPKA